MNHKTEQLNASLEDYLEAIFWIASSKGVARAKEIAKRLSVQAASVIGAFGGVADVVYQLCPHDPVSFLSEGNVYRSAVSIRAFF